MVTPGDIELSEAQADIVKRGKTVLKFVKMYIVLLRHYEVLGLKHLSLNQRSISSEPSGHCWEIATSVGELPLVSWFERLGKSPLKSITLKTFATVLLFVSKI